MTCIVKTYPQYIGIRLALGAAEATMYPGGYLILSMWYKPKELATRMSIFYGANTGAGESRIRLTVPTVNVKSRLLGAFGGMIAYGIGRLDYAHGWRAWRWLFLVSVLLPCK